MRDFNCLLYCNEKDGGNSIPLSKFSDSIECIDSTGLLELQNSRLFSLGQINK